MGCNVKIYINIEFVLLHLMYLSDVDCFDKRKRVLSPNSPLLLKITTNLIVEENIVFLNILLLISVD